MPRGHKRGLNDRTHSLFSDPEQFVADDHDAAVPVSLETRQKWRWEMGRRREQLACRWNSPVTHLIVLSFILATEPGTIIRAKRLRHVLAENRPDIAWDNINLGKILNTIASVAREQGKLADEDKTLKPARDWAGHLFEYDPSSDGYAILTQMRDWISNPAAENSKTYPYHGPTFVWEEFVSVPVKAL